MALKDKITLGMSLPHRSPEPIDMGVVRQVAQRADALGFRDLWVTENTLDHVFSFDPMVILTYAAAVTTRIRVGVSVAVLPIHHPILSMRLRTVHCNRPLPPSRGGCINMGIVVNPPA